MRSQPFHECAEFPFLSEFGRRWRDLRDELLVANALGVSYHPKRNDIIGPGSSWTQLELIVSGLPVPANLALAPLTTRLLSNVPNLLQAAVYGLGPRSHLQPHAGDDPQRLRAHIGLSCPAGCQLRVDTETRDERDGGILIFDDNFEHEAWNRSDEFRYVLHLDFVRPGFPPPSISTMQTQQRELARQNPEFVPLAIFAGMELDPGIRDEIRNVRGNHLDESTFAPDVWRAFLQWLDH